MMEAKKYLGNVVASYGPDPRSGFEGMRTITCNLKYAQQEENEANAELIIHAVNNIERVEQERDALLEALKSARQYIVNKRIWDNENFTQDDEEILDGANTAIASVEGGAK
jgi:hypothetical protein